MMNNKEILDNAPVGNYKSVKMVSGMPAVWVPDDYRSLADIKRIAELEKEREIFALEQQAKGLEDYAKNNSSGMNAFWLLAASDKLIVQANKLKEGDL